MSTHSANNRAKSIDPCPVKRKLYRTRGERYGCVGTNRRGRTKRKIPVIAQARCFRFIETSHAFRFTFHETWMLRTPSPTPRIWGNPLTFRVLFAYYSIEG